MPSQVPYHYYRMKQLRDGSWQIVFELPELPREDVATLIGASMIPGWLLTKSNEFTEAEVPQVDAPTEDKPKSQASRIRGVLFKLWEQRGSKGDFEVFYRTQTERFIEKLKEQLE